MTRTMQTAEDIGGDSSAVKEPGIYHVSILSAADGETTSGTVKSCCSAIMSVLAGSVDEQEEKQIKLNLWDPDMSKDGQEWKAKKQTAYAIAVGQLDPSKLGESVDIELGSNLDGVQLFIELDYGSKKKLDDSGEVVKDKQTGKIIYIEDKSKVELAWANIYHADDPRASKFKRNQEAFDLRPESHCKPAEYFDALNPKNKAAAKKAPKLDTSDL